MAFSSTTIRMLAAALPGLLAFLHPVAAAEHADPHQGHEHHGHAMAAGDAQPLTDLPFLRILLPKDGATVDPQLAVIFETPGDLDRMTMGAGKPGVHLHIDAKGLSMMPTAQQLIRLGEQQYLFLFDLPAETGEQTLSVYWSDAQHRTLTDSVQRVRVNVQAATPRKP